MHYIDYETFVLSLLIVTVVSLFGYILLFFLKDQNPEYHYIQVFLGILSIIYFLWILFIFIALRTRRRRNETQVSQFISGKAFKKWETPFKKITIPTIQNRDKISFENFIKSNASKDSFHIVNVDLSQIKLDLDKINNILGLVYDEFKNIFKTSDIIVSIKGRNNKNKKYLSIVTENVHGHVVDEIDFKNGAIVLIPPIQDSDLNLKSFMLVSIVNTEVDSVIPNFLMDDLKVT